MRACVLLDAANAPLAAAQRVLDAGRIVLAADTLGAAQHMFDQAWPSPSSACSSAA